MKRVILIISTLALIVGCTTKDNAKVEKFEKVHIVLGIEDLSTRTILDGRDIKWENGDVVGLWDGQALQPFTVTTAGSTGTILEGEITTSSEDKGYGSIEEGKYALVSQYDAVYPYSLGEKTTLYSDGVFSLDIPVEQKAIENTFQTGANVAVASFSPQDINKPIVFNNAVAYGKISIATEAVDAVQTLDKITLVAYEKWSGAVSVSSDASITDGSEASHLITLTKPDGGFQKGKTYYFTVKPGTYSRIDLVGMTESGQVHKVGSGIEFQRNTVTNLGTIKNQIGLDLWLQTGPIKKEEVTLLLVSEDGAIIMEIHNGEVILINPSSTTTITGQFKANADGNKRWFQETSSSRVLVVTSNGEITLSSNPNEATKFLCYKLQAPTNN